MVTTLATMAPVEVVCVLFALLTGGMAAVWLLFATNCVAYRLFRRELKWDTSWNSVVAPLATLAILCIALAMELESGFFRFTACVLIVISIILVITNICFGAWTAVQKTRRGSEASAITRSRTGRSSQEPQV
jgi:tellurite resistance protein TehA-like permease